MREDLKFDAARAMYAVTVTEDQYGIRGQNKDRTRVRNFAKSGASHNALYRAVHSIIKKKETDLDVVATFSIARRNTFVERVGILSPLELVDASLQIPGLPVSEQRALPSAWLMNIESAQRAIQEHGSSLEGLWVGYFETGNGQIDRINNATLEDLGQSGFRLDHRPKGIVEDIRHKARLALPGRYSWRSQMHLAFAPPEKVLDLAAEQKHVDAWLAQFDGLDDASVLGAASSALGTFLEASKRAGFEASKIYKLVLDAVARRIEAVSTEVKPDGTTTVRVDIREPANDNKNCGDTKAG
ncbi:MAG: hypothetical protein AAFP91_17180 [Pseudomonadota bacterium]